MNKPAVTKFLTMVLAAGFPFGGGMTLYFMSAHGTNKGLIMGVTSGILFGIAIATLQARRARRADAFRPAYAAEGILRDAAAVRIAPFSHGWLFLTKQRLVFEPFKSTSPTKLELPLAEIAAARLVNRGINKYLGIEDSLHQTHLFSVLERELWVTTISQALAMAAVPSPAAANELA